MADNFFVAEMGVTQVRAGTLLVYTRSSAVAEGPRDVHVIVVMPSLNMCEMATNCVMVYAKSRFSGLQFCR